MSFPPTNEPPANAPVPVFVDESGRRRARTRFLARTIVAGAGIYVLVVIAGLTGSVSLPGVHLGELPRIAAGRAHSSPLGPGSKLLSLPAALKPGSSTNGAEPSETTPGSGGAQGTAGPASGESPTATAGPTTTQETPPTSIRATTTTRPSRSTTTSTLPVTTTTKHGPPTSTSHGPPSTTPGQGTGRRNL